MLQLKVLHKQHKGKGNAKFTSFFTPMTIDGEKKFTTIKFDTDNIAKDVKEEISTKNYVIEVEDEDISLPKYYGAYVDKEGKTKYPYIYIKKFKLVEEIVSEFKEQKVSFN